MSKNQTTLATKPIGDASIEAHEGSLDSDIYHQIEKLCLNPEVIKRHHTTIANYLRDQKRPEFRIFDTCRPNNGGILQYAQFRHVFGNPTDILSKGDKSSDKIVASQGFVGFIPAAGAASRYSQPLGEVAKIVENCLEVKMSLSLAEDLKKALDTLKSEGAETWPLPDRLRRLMNARIENLQSLTNQQCIDLLVDLQLPKALMPCVAEGISFLTLKNAEHLQLANFSGQVFVTPVDYAKEFRRSLESADDITPPELRQLKTYYLEQGPELSTIRFNSNGGPLTDKEGKISTVPAGHGALAELFPQIKKLLPSAHSLFIRNIDNVMGLRKTALEATREFLYFHDQILGILAKVRTSLLNKKLNHAATEAKALLSLAHTVPFTITQSADLLTKIQAKASPSEAILWEVLLRLFHTHPIDSSRKTLSDQLQELYSRPLNILGQVPNTLNDVGGTPCFIYHKGQIEKICIEVPHVSAQDKKDFLQNPQKATHFNPVFVAAEITTDPAYYQKQNQDFWILAEKTYKGAPVLYVETVLYELLGNSQLANCLFVEVPRDVFNPHKTLKDAATKSIAAWRDG